MEDPRKKVRALAQKYRAENRALDWFEVLYAEAEAAENTQLVPWADLAPNPNLVQAVQKDSYQGRALVIGCGLGDDAEYLQSLGLSVDALDISPSAIKICRKRFPHTDVHYLVADILTFAPTVPYDLVVESYTLQSLPVELRAEVIQRLPKLTAVGGTLLIICRGRENDDWEERLPFPLSRVELEPLQESCHLRSWEDYPDEEDPPVRRFRAVYERFQ